MYPFRYCTVNQAKAYAELSQASVDDILKRIELWSSVINDYTRKWFVPVHFQGEIQILHDEDFVFPGYIPIIEMTQPQIVEFSSQGGRKIVPLATDALNVDGGAIKQYDYVNTQGYFGLIEHGRSKVTTSVMQDAAIESEEINLVDKTGIEAGRVLIIGDRVSCIVVDICPNDDHKIQVDKLAEPVSEDDVVIQYGSVPVDINWAVMECVAKKGYGAREQRNLMFQERMISETTDNYTYRLSNQNQSAAAQGTGIADVDRVLSNYREVAEARWV